MLLVRKERLQIFKLHSRSKARKFHRQGPIKEYKYETQAIFKHKFPYKTERKEQVHAATWAGGCAPGASASSCGRSPGSAAGPRNTPTLREHPCMWLVATQHLPLWSLCSDDNALFLGFDTSHRRGMLLQHASTASTPYEQPCNIKLHMSSCHLL